MPSICFTCRQITDCKKCSKCRLVKYCSSDCQNNDWTKHKVICEDYRILRIYLAEKKLVESNIEVQLNDYDNLSNENTILTENESNNSEQLSEPPELILPQPAHPFMSNTSDTNNYHDEYDSDGFSK